MKSKIFIIMLMATFLFSLASVSALTNSTVCCEKTKTNLFCQNVPSEECAVGSKTAPTACESTSYCKPGVCYNSIEGTCLDNTPQLVCNNNGGVWSKDKPASCNLGCCILGDQAAFVSLTRCKYLSSVLGLITNYKKNVNDEVSCVLEVTNQDKGACVFDYEFQRACKFTTREQCSLGFNGIGEKGQFFKGKLCSNEALDTICAPSKKTTCAPGKDGVYFLDTCGNIANIYDSTKIPSNESLKIKEVRDYWDSVKTREESCNPSSGNANSNSCGNCDYLSGSYCRPSGDISPIAGDYVCSDLNCKNTQNGNNYKHGESWCVYNDKGKTGQGKNAVGSQFFKHICINGEEVLEACADFRQQECIQDKIEYTGGSFSQAACRVNRWQECNVQYNKQDCENQDRRDCLWKADLENLNRTLGVCVPKNAPGLEFWKGEETQTICSQANFDCVVTFEKGLFGGESCKTNCQCLNEDWKKSRIEYCESLGDCGPGINWLGQQGYKSGYNITVK